MREPAADPRDVALGVVVTGARALAGAGRLALLPLRAAARAPVVGSRLRRAADDLASEGRSGRDQGLAELEAATGALLGTPEVERAVDHVLEGPLPDAVGRSLAEHRVVERIAAQVLASPEFEAAVASALEHETAHRLVERTLASPGVDRLAADIVESRLTAELAERVAHSPEVRRAVEEIASSPEVRSALMRQTTGFGDEVVSAVRRRAESADGSAERKVRGWLRRPRIDRDRTAPYAGVATRAIGLVVDAAIVHFTFVVGVALIGLLVALVGGELRPEWLVALLVGSGWGLVAGSYFVLFWTLAGQTPGMRLMRLRVLDATGRPPGVGRSFVRLLGGILAIVPLFAGFLPVLFDDRRRGLQDFLAGTVVVYDDGAPAVAEAVGAAPSGLPAPEPR